MCKYRFYIMVSAMLALGTISCTKEEPAKPVLEHQTTEVHFKDEEEDDPIIMRILIGKTQYTSSSTIVELVDSQSSTVIATTTVNINGNYSFINVMSGSYTVYVKVNGVIMETLNIVI